MSPRSFLGPALLIGAAGLLLGACSLSPKPAVDPQRLAQSCQGIGLPEAAPYPAGPGLHRVMVVHSSGERHAWSSSLPEDWIASSLESTELVACVDEYLAQPFNCFMPPPPLNTFVCNTVSSACARIGNCPGSLMSMACPAFSPPPDGYVYALDVTIRDAHSGALVAQGPIFPADSPFRQGWLDCTLVSQAGAEYHPTREQLQQALGDLVEQGRWLRTLEGGAWSGSAHLTWSPDSRYIIAANSLWDVASGRQTVLGESATDHAVEFGWPLTTSASGSVLSPDGTILAINPIWWSNDGAITLASYPAGEQLRLLTGHTKTITSLAWSPDGTMLASSSSDGSIILWDTQTGQPIRTIRDETIGAMASLAFSPDGRVLALGAFGEIVLWNPETGLRLRTLRTVGAHGGSIHSVSWLPDGKVLASSAWDGTIALWDPETGDLLNLVKAYPDDMQILSVAWSPDGSMLASGWHHGKIIVWLRSALLAGR